MKRRKCQLLECHNPRQDGRTLCTSHCIAEALASWYEQNVDPPRDEECPELLPQGQGRSGWDPGRGTW